MAKFEHRRYPALTLQDTDGIWAQFTPEERSFGEHTIKVGVLETGDEKLIKRLRAATKTDKHLTEAGEQRVRAPKAPDTKVPETPVTEPQTPPA